MWPQWIQITKLIFFFCKAYLFLVKLESLRVCRDGLVFNSQTLPLKASLLPFQTYMVTLKVIQNAITALQIRKPGERGKIATFPR